MTLLLAACGGGTTGSSRASEQSDSSHGKSPEAQSTAPSPTTATAQAGQVWTWGKLTGSAKPKRVSELSNVVDVAEGEGTGLLAVTSDGAAFHWGEYVDGENDGESAPTKVSGAYENLSAVDLVEDALRINAAAFDRHRIEVVREFDENTPPVSVDRHKVLQILINLVRNAKYAMDRPGSDGKRLVIRVGLASPDRVKIIVRDNGVGIAPDNLVKIFNHGFTTKKDGHGFGLHSGANAAKEMGGHLMVHSDGLGKGAEFTLELPTITTVRKDESLTTQGKI